MELLAARSSELSADELAEIRLLLETVFGERFSVDDWRHALGGWHVIARDGSPVGHAAVVERDLEIDGRLFRAGYVEAVATRPSHQGRGVGTALMTAVAEVVVEDFEIGALSTGRHRFYERLGWQRWRGPSYVRDGERLTRTADEDAGIMVLRFGLSAEVSVHTEICCQARRGDDW